MNLRDNFHSSFMNLRANKTRSLLSMMGVVIGTGAVILVISIVNGTRKATLEQMKAGKENMLLLRAAYSESTGRFGKISLDDVERIKTLPHVFTAFPDVIQETEARGSFGKAKLVFFGVDHHYTQLYKHQLVSGRFFTKEDTDTRPRICVISDKMAQKLFGFDYPVGQRLRLGIGALEVVGVFKSEERLKRMDQYGDLLIPIFTSIQMLDNFTIYSVQIRAQEGRTAEARKAVQAYLDEKGVERGSLQFSDIQDYFKETEKWARDWMLQMALISGISLLVGGIGLMNVMLTTVAERTHEIGLRKAVGADHKAILHQFLVEAITLSSLGGTVGIILGLLLSYSLSILSQGKILVAVLPLSLAISFIFSLGIGVLFGLFPASKAARLSPVDALRFE